MALHDALAERLRPGDRLVYLGNYTGYGPYAAETLDEMVRFRRWFLSFPPYQAPDDVVFLRGAQEEIWSKLLQLQFAPDPRAVLDWMLQRGLAPTLTSFGSGAEQALDAVAEGTLAITYWTNRLRESARTIPGFDALVAALKRASYTEDGALLFVNAGLDTEKPLSRQTDSFWWAARSFAEIDEPYQGFRRIVRGFDPDAAERAQSGETGLREGEYTLSIDSGAGRGGPLNAVCLSASGELVETLSI